MFNLISLHIDVKSQFLEAKSYSWKKRIYFSNTSVSFIVSCIKTVSAVGGGSSYFMSRLEGGAKLCYALARTDPREIIDPLKGKPERVSAAVPTNKDFKY